MRIRQIIISNALRYTHQKVKFTKKIHVLSLKCGSYLFAIRMFENSNSRFYKNRPCQHFSQTGGKTRKKSSVRFVRHVAYRHPIRFASTYILCLQPCNFYFSRAYLYAFLGRRGKLKISSHYFVYLKGGIFYRQGLKMLFPFVGSVSTFPLRKISSLKIMSSMICIC